MSASELTKSVLLIMGALTSIAFADPALDQAGLDLLGGAGQLPKMEKVSYLGVTAKPVDDALRAQLNLPDDVGLTIMTVDRKGPAAADLQVNDVLQKLDDQLLIDPHQLVTLIHLHHPGDTVTLTVIRQAKPMQVTIKLGEKEKISAPANDSKHASDLSDPKLPDGFPPPVGFDTPSPPGRGDQVSMSFKDDVYSAVIINDPNGDKRLTVKDSAGYVVAQGPANTDEEWNKFSPEIRSHLEVMRKVMNQPQK